MQGPDEPGCEDPRYGIDVALEPRRPIPSTDLSATTCQPPMGCCVGTRLLSHGIRTLDQSLITVYLQSTTKYLGGNPTPYGESMDR